MPNVRTILPILGLAVGLAATAWSQQAEPGRGLHRLDAQAKVAGGPLYTGSHALVIGVEHYAGTWRALTGVAGEVELVARTLTELGFATTRVLDPTGEELHAAFQRFVDDHGYEPEHRLFVFFAGHAHVRQGDRSYLVPADAPAPDENPAAFLRVALPMTQLMAWARTMEAKHVLFALDCDAGDTVFGTRSQAPSPAVMDNLSRPVRQFIVAGQPGSLKPERGAFAAALVAGIGGKADANADGFVTGTELGMYMREDVQRRQGALVLFGKIRDPDLDEGDFCFQVAGNARGAEQSRLQTELDSLREQRQRLEEEARAIVASRRQDVEWEGLELALQILEEADKRADLVSTRNVTPEADALAGILSQAASRALTGGDLAGASALASQAAMLSPGRAGVMELLESVRSQVGKGRIEVRRGVAMQELARTRELELPAEVRPGLDHLDQIIARYLSQVDPQDSRNAEFWYHTITWRARGLQAVAAGRGTSLFAEIELLGPLVAQSNGPPFDLHLGNLTAMPLTVDLAGSLRTLCVVLTGPLPQRLTFVLPEPFYAHQGTGQAKVLGPNEHARLRGSLLSPDRLPPDFFPTREYAVPPPGMYEMQVQISFPRSEGTWSGTYQSLPRMVQVWTREQRAARMQAQ